MKTAFAGVRFLDQRPAALLAVAVAVLIASADIGRGKDQPDDATEPPAPFGSQSEVWQPMQNGRQLLGESPFETSRLDKLNLTVRLPGSPWVKAKQPPTWQYGGVFMMRANPDIIVMLNGEPMGVEMKPDVYVLAKAARAKLAAMSASTVFTDEKEETISGIRGRSFEASMVGPAVLKYWLVWVGTHNGYSYELIFAGNPSKALEISEVSLEFRRGMVLIDSK